MSDARTLARLREVPLSKWISLKGEDDVRVPPNVEIIWAFVGDAAFHRLGSPPGLWGMSGLYDDEACARWVRFHVHPDWPAEYLSRIVGWLRAARVEEVLHA